MIFNLPLDPFPSTQEKLCVNSHEKQTKRLSDKKKDLYLHSPSKVFELPAEADAILDLAQSGKWEGQTPVVTNGNTEVCVPFVTSQRGGYQ